MPFSFSNLKSPKNERSLKGTGSSCNNRTFNVDADNDDDDDDDDDDDNAGDDYGSGGCGGVNRELEQKDDHKDDFKKAIGLMIKATALHVHQPFKYISLTSTA